MKKLFTLLPILIIILSCSKKVRKDLTDGEYIVEHYINDSVKHGKSIIYYNDGRKQRIIKYKKNTIVGQMKLYHPNGKIASKTKFRKGVVKDKFYNFHSNGKPYNTYIYKENKLVMVENCYDGKGNKLDCGKLKNGTGFINQYNAYGNLIAIDYMKVGKYIKTDSIQKNKF
ncbi:hypothetical protein [Chishuiella sp.]|uniref:toxin-antitoxin system YwqK family antitoxin n=1 Tax=Chishuiella sp. TaxID=1969467 RepID=UPI0028AF645D|nr:hypothetical protein [Chishuiella sp.]